MDKKVDKIFKEIKDYYQYLKAIDAYPAYRDGINTGYASCVTDIKNIHESISYKRYAAYKSEDPEAIKSALAHRQEIEDYNSSYHEGEKATDQNCTGGKKRVKKKNGDLKFRERKKVREKF